MNTGIIDGRLGKDPEIYSPNDSEFRCLKFSICNNDERRQNAQGEYESVPSWFDIEYWTKKPQHWIQQLKKGTHVVIEYTAKQQTWEKDGQHRIRVVFYVKKGTFPLVIAHTGDGSAHKPATDPPAQNGKPFESYVGKPSESFEYDIPF